MTGNFRGESKKLTFIKKFEALDSYWFYTRLTCRKIDRLEHPTQQIERRINTVIVETRVSPRRKTTVSARQL